MILDFDFFSSFCKSDIYFDCPQRDNEKLDTQLTLDISYLITELPDLDLERLLKAKYLVKSFGTQFGPSVQPLHLGFIGYALDDL